MPIRGLLYGVVCYAIFLGTFLYAIGFLGDAWVPRTVDRGGPVGSTGTALLIDLVLLSIFALQHSVMARQGFKRAWTAIVPEPVERATYVLASSLAMILLFWQWRPLPKVIWDLHSPAVRMPIWILFGAGWGLVLLSTFLINHFELFGLLQVWRHAKGHVAEPVRFREPFLYRFVRHPLYVGWIVVFFAVPTMTAGHLLFSVMATGYILVAIRLEERDLRALHPEYAEYSQRVSMLIPGMGRNPRELET